MPKTVEEDKIWCKCKDLTPTAIIEKYVKLFSCPATLIDKRDQGVERLGRGRSVSIKPVDMQRKNKMEFKFLANVGELIY